MRTELERRSFEGIFAEIGYHKTSESWVIASSEIKNHLGKGIEWCKHRKKLSDALNGIANTDARSIKIVAHGDQNSIIFGNRYSSDAIRHEFGEAHSNSRLNNIPIALWSCFGGAKGGIGEIIQKATGAIVHAADKTLGNGRSINSLDQADSLDQELANLPFALHTNAVGFTIEDNKNGTFGFYLYYGSWHSNYANHGSPSLTEGALSLYTLSPGTDGTDPANYTVEAYGQGGALANKTFLPVIPGHITSDIHIKSLSQYIETDRSPGTSGNEALAGDRTDMTDMGFTPGENFFFVNGNGDLVTYNSTNGSSIDNTSATFGFQSFYLPTVTPGTYRPFYDGNAHAGSGGYNTKNTWDNVHPIGTNRVTANFSPHGNLGNALVTITQTGQLIYGEAPKILINRVEDDNGASATDMVTSGRNVVIHGEINNVAVGNDYSSLTVTLTDKNDSNKTVIYDYEFNDTELVVDNSGNWTLTIPGEVDSKLYDIKATITDAGSDYTANQDLNIVSTSIESCDEDNGISDSDFKTSDTTQVITGIWSHLTATNLKISITDSLGIAIVANEDPTQIINDTWIYDLTNKPLNVGTYLIESTVIEGGTSVTATRNLEIQALPGAPTIDAITNDTGVPGDFSTEDDQVIVNGTFDVNAVTATSGELRLSLASNTYLNAATGLTIDYNAGTYSFTSKVLDIGQYTIKAETIDANGLYNSTEQILYIIDKNDKTPPPAPTIDTLAPDTGVVGDWKTNSTSITISGTYNSTETVGLNVSFGGVTYTLGTDRELISTASGTWTLAVPGKASSGTVVATAIDAGGNKASATQDVTIYGVTLSPNPSAKSRDNNGNLITSEDRSSNTFTIVLDAQPSADVTVSLTGLDNTEGVLDQSSLVFTPSNWNTPQTVTVTGINDDVIDGDQTYIVTARASAGGGFTGNEIATINVSNLDIGTTRTVTPTPTTPGVSITPSSSKDATDSNGNLITTEDETSVTFTVVLDSQPNADLVVSLSGLDETEGKLDQSSLTFTTANWNTPQTVTVTGVNDSVVDPDITYLITATAGTESDTIQITNLNKQLSISELADQPGIKIEGAGENGLWLKFRTTEANAALQNSLNIYQSSSSDITSIGATAGSQNMGYTEIFVKADEILTFKQHSTDNALNEAPRIQFVETEDGFRIMLEDTSGLDDDHNDLVIDVTSSTSPTSINNVQMASMQSKSSHAILDLSSIDVSGAKVELSLTSDCSFNNQLGFVRLDVDPVTGKPFSEMSINGIGASSVDKYNSEIIDNLISPNNSALFMQGQEKSQIEWVLDAEDAGYYSAVLITPEGNILSAGTSSLSGADQSVKLLGQNHLAFEDGVDGDYNDFVLKANFA